MTSARFLLLTLAAGVAAHADFSYSVTRKGMNMPGAGDQTSKYYFKGNKMMTDLGNTAMILDFDAQTITQLDRGSKTYTVRKFADEGGSTALQDAKMDADFKETGQHKTINGYDSSQGILTVQVEMPQAQAGMKMQMEIEYWVSPDVPGYSEFQAFYKRNLPKFPWGAMVQNANPSMKTAMAEMQKKMATMHGAPVLQIMRTKMAGGSSMSPQQQAQQAQARAQLEAMQKQGGPQGAAAARALAALGGASGGGGGMEITMESSGFSAAPVADSTFAIPAGYQQK